MLNFNQGQGKMIVKKIAIAGLCMVLGSSLNAKNMSENEVFIGLEVGYSEVQGERIGFFENKNSDVSYGARIGAQSDEWRAMFLYNYYNNSGSDQNLEQGLVTLDYFFMGKDSSEDTTFSPYFGANVGYANYESSFVDESDMIYGGQAGLVIDVMESVDLDFAYRYSWSNGDALDHVGGFIFSVNYIY